MAHPLNKAQIDELSNITRLLQEKPELLDTKDLSFMKSFIEHFGGTVPEKRESNSCPFGQTKAGSKEAPSEPEQKHESESEESDVDLDMTGVIEPDTDAPQKMGNLTLQPTEEEITEAQAKRSEAVSAFVEKDYEKAIALYTEAIVLNPHAALLYAKRGQIYLLLQKPNACIRDCNRALEINPDSAAGHKFRGRAYQLLGKWEEAANDLRLACQYDFDEEANEWLREVTPNARKIEEHIRKRERKQVEKAERERRERLAKAREEAKRREENSRPSQTEGDGAAGMEDFYKFINDPEVLQAFKDPEVAEAFSAISSNPANIMKYQSNPKIMSLIQKFGAKFGGAGGMAGFPGMMGNMPGFPGAGAPPPPQPPQPDDDVGLD